MAKSTQVITDLTTVATGTFSATSLSNSIAAAGPIQDLPGNAAIALLKAQELLVLCNAMLQVIDAGDSLKTQVQAVHDVLV